MDVLKLNKLHIFTDPRHEIFYLTIEREEVSAILWAILAGIFSLGIYILVLLSIDYYMHRRIEEMAVRKLNELLSKMGLSKAGWREYYEERNILLYALATLLTLGIFTIYWFYAVTKDQNEHFMTHERFESRLISVLERV